MNNDHDHVEMQSTLDQILAEQRLTNGRVTRLEGVSNQHHRLLLGSEEEHSVGLVEAVRANREVVETVQVFIVWLRRAAIAFVTAAVGLGLNLLADTLT